MGKLPQITFSEGKWTDEELKYALKQEIELIKASTVFPTSVGQLWNNLFPGKSLYANPTDDDMALENLELDSPCGRACMMIMYKVRELLDVMDDHERIVYPILSALKVNLEIAYFG